MPLTPSDVANKQFKSDFRKHYYVADEVDAFLDEVESELARLLRENAELRARGGSSSAGAAGPAVSLGKPDGAGPGAGAAAGAAAAQGPAPEPAAPAPPVAAVAKPTGQESALRMLQLAQRTADEAVAEARAEAEAMVAEATARADALRGEAEQTLSAAREEAGTTLGGARTEADTTLASAREEAATTLSEARSRAQEQLASAGAEAASTLSTARAEAERLLVEAQARSEQVHAELSARMSSEMADLDDRRTRLERHIEELREFEREYRTRLKAYLEAQLRELGGITPPADAEPLPAGTAAALLVAPAAAAPAVVAADSQVLSGPDADGVVMDDGAAAVLVPEAADEGEAAPGPDLTAQPVDGARLDAGADGALLETTVMHDGEPRDEDGPQSGAPGQAVPDLDLALAGIPDDGAQPSSSPAPDGLPEGVRVVTDPDADAASPTPSGWLGSSIGGLLGRAAGHPDEQARPDRP